MTVPVTEERNDYEGDGTLAVYEFQFRIYDADELRVYQDDILLVETIDYTVTGVDDPGGGEITLVAGNLGIGVRLALVSEVPLSQSTDLRNQGKYLPSMIERAFDRCVRMIKQLAQVLDRAIKVPISEEAPSGGFILPSVADRANTTLGFDNDGAPIPVASTTGALVTPYMETVLDDTTPAAARTTLETPSVLETVLRAMFTTKGDSAFATGSGVPARFGVGSDGQFIEASAAAASGVRWGIPSKAFEARLTPTSGVPITTTDVLAAETIYLTPYGGDTITLYDGANWRAYRLTEISADVPDVTAMHDVFVYDNAGTLTLDVVQWTNDTTRATALATQNGILVKTGATGRRYVGSFYSTTAGNGQTEDSVANRFIWNYYNRVLKPMRSAPETTDSWTYMLAAFRQANANTANQLNFIIGVAEDFVEAKVIGACENANTGGNRVVGIGLDSTTANATGVICANCNTSSIINQRSAEWRGYPGIGKHYLAWLEYSTATGTTTWQGDAGVPTITQAGIHGVLRG